MDVWWDSLAAAMRVFYGIAIVSSLVLLFQLALLVFGVDGDADLDANVDGFDGDSGGGGGQFLSVRAVTAFFVGFGWAGVAALDAGQSLPAAISLAFLVGGALMATVVALMRFLYGLGHSGTLDYRNAIGVAGSVYLPVPANMEGPGQVEVLVQGRLQVVQAFTKATEPLGNRARIKVVDVIDPQTLLVEPLKNSPQES